MKNRVSDNVSGVKHFLSALLHTLETGTLGLESRRQLSNSGEQPQLFTVTATSLMRSLSRTQVGFCPPVRLTQNLSCSRSEIGSGGAVTDSAIDMEQLDVTVYGSTALVTG